MDKQQHWNNIQLPRRGIDNSFSSISEMLLRKDKKEGNGKTKLKNNTGRNTIQVIIAQSNQECSCENRVVSVSAILC